MRLSATGRENRTPEPVLPPRVLPLRVPPRVLVAGLVAGVAVNLSKESVEGTRENPRS